MPVSNEQLQRYVVIPQQTNRLKHGCPSLIMMNSAGKKTAGLWMPRVMERSQSKSDWCLGA